MNYRNKHGKLVEVKASQHALDMFVRRWNRMFPENPIQWDVALLKMEEWFGHSQRVVNLSGEDKRRLGKHGGDTMYFRTNAFTFVVQNSVVVTAEISDDGMRGLNKRNA